MHMPKTLLWLALSLSLCCPAAADPESPLSARIDALRAELERRAVQERPDVALPLGLELVALHEEAQSPAAARVEPLHLLAVLHFAAEQDAEAELAFERAVAAAESAAGEYSLQLVPILRHQARLFTAQGRLDEAEDRLRRAQHITHREHGVDNLEQVRLIDEIIAIQLRDGRYRDADLQQRFHYELHRSQYGDGDVRMLPAMKRMGQWLSRSGQFDEARAMYRQLLENLDEWPDRSVLERVDPLRAIAAIRLAEGLCCADEPLEEALQVVMNDPASDRQDRARALMELADIKLLQREADVATELYQRAWIVMDEESAPASDPCGGPRPLGVAHVEDMSRSFRRALARQRATSIRSPFLAERSREELVPGSAVQRFGGERERDPVRLIGGPVPLCQGHVRDLLRRDELKRLDQLYMDLTFAVNEKGRVQQVEVVESNIPVRLVKYVKSVLREIRFRPRIADGAPVATERVAWRQTFLSRNSLAPEQRFAFGDGVVGNACQLVAAN